MHVAVATSLAVIVPTGLSSARSHAKRGAVAKDLLMMWAPAMVIAAFVGGVTAGFYSAQVMSLIFGVMAFFIAVNSVVPIQQKLMGNLGDSKPTHSISAAFIGYVSSSNGHRWRFAKRADNDGAWSTRAHCCWHQLGTWGVHCLACCCRLYHIRMECCRRASLFNRVYITARNGQLGNWRHRFCARRGHDCAQTIRGAVETRFGGILADCQRPNDFESDRRVGRLARAPRLIIVQFPTAQIPSLCS